MTEEYDTFNKGLSIASLVLGILGIVAFSTGLVIYIFDSCNCLCGNLHEK